MKYKVKITQRIDYGQNIVGTFSNMAAVQTLIESVFKHFENVSAEIEIYMEESEVAKDE